MRRLKAPELEQVFEANLNLERVEDPDIKPQIKIDMDESDKEQMDFIIKSIEETLRNQFPQVFAIENQLLAKVRTPLPAYDGPGWVMNKDGSYMEDWSRISLQDMEQFIQAATAEVFFSSQRVIDSYAEAVITKYTYDDAYDAVYSSTLTGTVGDKTAKAKRKTQDERWVALYKTLYYKKANELINRLETHVRRVERIYTERQKENERGFRASRNIGG